MVMEKQAAAVQAWMGIWAEGLRFQQQLAMSMLTLATPTQHMARVKTATTRVAGAVLAPYHRKAAANAKRLSRTKLL